MSIKEFERVLNSSEKTYQLIDNFLNKEINEEIQTNQNESKQMDEDNQEGEEIEEGEEEYEIRNPKTALRWFEKLLLNVEKLKKHSNQKYFKNASNFLENFEKNEKDFEIRINEQILDFEINNFLEKKGKRDFNRILNALIKKNPSACISAKTQLEKDVQKLKESFPNDERSIQFVERVSKIFLTIDNDIEEIKKNKEFKLENSLGELKNFLEELNLITKKLKK
jgi:hypothetical protein